MWAYALGRDRLPWLVGLSVLALASAALQAVMGLQVGTTLGISGSPAGMVALLLGLLLDLVLWLLAMKVAVEALRHGAEDRDDGDAGGFVEDGLALRHLVLWLALGLAGLLLAWSGGAGFALYLIAVIALLPALLSLLTMEGSLWRAFDPRAWVEMLQRAGVAYLPCAALLGALLLAAGVASWGFGLLLPAWLAPAPSRFVQLLALFAGYHALGRWLHAQREAFAMTGPARLARPQLASFDEDAAMREADVLALEDPAAGAARLSVVLRGRGGSPPVHARYRELLQAAGDREALLAHDREYTAVLLALGQERQALSLYLSARALDPGFELEGPQELGQLIVLTERIGQLQLAVTLAHEYQRRFPRTRDAVALGLRAARLLASRLDRAADARLLLQELLARDPEHALRAELDQALAALPTD